MGLGSSKGWLGMRLPVCAGWLALLLFGAPSPGQGVGLLVQPDGSRVSLQEAAVGDRRVLTFPHRAVSSRSWLSLPVGAAATEIQVVTPEGPQAWLVPTVVAPGTRIAFEVPGSVVSVSLRGVLPEALVLTRTVVRPGDPVTPWVTRSLTDLQIDLPPWTVPEGFTPLLRVTRAEKTPWEGYFSRGKRLLHVRFQPSVTQWDFSPDAWGFVPSRIVIPGDASLTEVRVRAVGRDADLPADPKTILAWPASRWRDPRREWFSWSGTSVLVLVTADYQAQDDYLKRLAYFVEKPGFRGTLAQDAQIAKLHGWNAHDYAAPDLARFFAKAQSEGFPLNRSEVELRDRLVAAGILVATADRSWAPGTGALVGISLESPPALRATFLVHESFHGLYYTSKEFRDGVARAWDGLSEGARARFRSFLAHFSAESQYDAANEALMINEFQAYLLQRSAREWTLFLRERVLAREARPEEAKAWLEEYLTAARSLDGLVHGLYGLNSGNVSLVTVLSKPET